MAGSTAAANIEGFVYTAMNAFYQTALSFTGQNMGAKKYDRVAKILRICILCVTVTGVVLGCGAYLLGTPLLSIYTSDPEVIQYGLERMLIVCVPYFLCGIMGHARGRFARYGVFDHADDCIAYRCVCAACSVDPDGLPDEPHAVYTVPLVPGDVGRDGGRAFCVLPYRAP